MLRLQNVVDVVHPLALLVRRLRVQHEAGVAAMRIGGAQLEAIVAHRGHHHFVDLSEERMGTHATLCDQ